MSFRLSDAPVVPVAAGLPGSPAMRRLPEFALRDLAGAFPASAVISVVVVFMGGAFVEEPRQPRLPPPNPPIERVVGGSGRSSRLRSVPTAMLGLQAKSNGIAVL